MNDPDPMIVGNGTAPAATIPTGTVDFAENVLAASRTHPVIVDFWAEWCGPCKQLTPLLEAAVAVTDGRVSLVKVNVDENQDLAAQLRVQSIPAVFAFVDGQPVDGFLGALPDSEVQAFVNRVAGTSAGAATQETENRLGEADKALAGGQENAAELYASVLAQDETNARAIAGLGKAFLKAGKPQDARQILDGVSEDLAKDPALESLRSALALASEAADSGDVETLTQQVEANPNDHQKRFDLANALLAVDRREEAVDHLIEIVRRERKWKDEAARKRLLKLFEAFGEEDPLTAEARMRLSTVLFV